jgi:hypothetical protein
MTEAKMERFTKQATETESILNVMGYFCSLLFLSRKCIVEGDGLVSGG